MRWSSWRQAGAWAGLILGLAGAACGPRGAPGECESNRDCPAGICLDQRCVPFTSNCAMDEHCRPDQACASGVCLTGCRWDSACPAGQVCEAAACRPGCRADGDCPGGEECQVATRTCGPRACVREEDCPVGFACLLGACASLGLCQVDADCPVGQVCAPERRCQPGCRVEADCPVGQQCLAGGCEPRPGCASDDDCDWPGVCLEGACVPDGCRADVDCALGEACLQGHCRAIECLEDAQCLPGQRCQAYACRPWTCQAQADCPAGARCLDGLCLFQECLRDEHCPAHLACAQGACGPRACLTGADCPAGVHCLDGACRLESCLRDEHCPAGEVCDPRGCRPGRCELMAGPCPEGMKCGLEEQCVPAGDGHLCLAGQQDDCPAGALCTGYTGYACHGLCATGSGQGCGPGESCAALGGLPGYGTCECNPMQQACGALLRCAYDGSGAPVCQAAGDGSACFQAHTDDCPAGYQCAHDGAFSECYALCLPSSGAGCPARVACYRLDGLGGHGLCVSECNPVRQDCPSGWKCALDGATPTCYTGAGQGGLCRSGQVDDCPLGWQCVYDGSAFGCYRLCHRYSGIGCGPGQRCAALQAPDQWGVCL